MVSELKYYMTIIICVSDDVRIDKMLQSIYEKLEIIVVLNGATEEVKQMVKKYKVRMIEIPERNLSKARNVGITNASFDKVVFYDSDCVMTPGSIEKYDKLLEKYLLVDGSVYFRKENFQSRVISVLRSMGLPGSAICPSLGINKKILKKIDYFFDEDIKWVEDGELNIRCRKAKIKAGVIKDITCIHDNLKFKQDLISAYRYGIGTKIMVKKGLQRKKRPDANWNLIIPCFKIYFLSGVYSIIWNLVLCLGYYLYKGEKNESKYNYSSF